MKATVSPWTSASAARSASTSRAQPWMSPTTKKRPISPPSEEPFESTGVFQDAQGSRVRIEVPAAHRFEERRDPVGRAAKAALEPAAELLIEDVDELALATHAVAPGTVGVGGDERAMRLQRLEERVDADARLGLREQHGDAPRGRRAEVQHLRQLGPHPLRAVAVG